MTANTNKNAPKVSAFEGKLRNMVGKTIIASRKHAEDLFLTVRMAAAFAIFHGRSDYLVKLDNELSNNDRVSMASFLSRLNKEGLNTLFVGFDTALADLKSKIEGDKDVVPLFSKTVKEGIRVATSNPSKIMREKLKETYKEEDALVTAMGKLPMTSNEEADKKMLDFGEYLSRVVGTIIRNVHPDNPEEAKALAKGINRMVHGEDKNGKSFKRADSEIDKLVTERVAALIAESKEAANKAQEEAQAKEQEPTVEDMTKAPKRSGKRSPANEGIAA